MRRPQHSAEAVWARRLHPAQDLERHQARDQDKPGGSLERHSTSSAVRVVTELSWAPASRASRTELWEDERFAETHVPSLHIEYLR